MMSTSIAISTQNLLLRLFQEADIEKVFYGLSHPDVIRYYGVQYDSLSATQAQMDWFNELTVTQTGQWWAICSADDAVFYGAIGFNNWSQAHQKAEIGFWLLPEYWGKGIISEAITAACTFAVEHMQLHRIEALVETPNEASKKVLTAAGFVYEGTMIDCEIKHGQFISLAIFAKIIT